MLILVYLKHFFFKNKISLVLFYMLYFFCFSFFSSPKNQQNQDFMIRNVLLFLYMSPTILTKMVGYYN